MRDLDEKLALWRSIVAEMKVIERLVKRLCGGQEAQGFEEQFLRDLGLRS